MKENRQALLSINDLSVSFGETGNLFNAVSGLSLNIYPGEIIGLIGESGSGKTTAAHSVMGLIDGVPGITGGQIKLNSRSILPDMSKYITRKNSKIYKRNSAFRKHQRNLLKNVLGKEIVAIFQEPKTALNPYISIKEHLLECISKNKAFKDDPVSLGQEILSQVGIVDGKMVWDLYPHQLSGGMAQRIMIAMSLSTNPKLIIADEPTTALDVTTQAKLLELFTKLKTIRRLSILLITHDIGVVQNSADRVYVMLKGKIVENGPTSKVLKDPQHPYTQKLLEAFNKIGERRVTIREMKNFEDGIN